MLSNQISSVAPVRQLKGGEKLSYFSMKYITPKQIIMEWSMHCVGIPSDMQTRYKLDMRLCDDTLRIKFWKKYERNIIRIIKYSGVYSFRINYKPIGVYNGQFEEMNPRFYELRDCFWNCTKPTYVCNKKICEFLQTELPSTVQNLFKSAVLNINIFDDHFCY